EICTSTTSSSVRLDRIACRKFLRATSCSSWCKTYQATSSSAACSEAQGSILGSSCFVCSNPNTEQRVVAFDFFETPRDVEFRYAIDKECLEAHAEVWTSQEVLIVNCKAWGFERLKLIAGDVAATTREYARSQLGARIALLYLDLDNYEGTLACLRNLYPLVSPGGVVAFDEYALAGYGESDAVDEFFRGQKIRLRSFPWAKTPMAFLVKEAA